jgi:hypothetical protein
VKASPGGRFGNMKPNSPSYSNGFDKLELNLSTLHGQLQNAFSEAVRLAPESPTLQVSFPIGSSVISRRDCRVAGFVLF